MLRNRYATDKKYRKRVDSLAGRKGSIWRAVAWICGGNRLAGKKAIENLVRTPLRLPKASGSYGNGMNMAIAYDLLENHPDWTTEMRQRVNLLLQQSLQESFRVLDGKSASLWHGRFQLACATWVVASVLDDMEDENRQLLSRAQSHFLDAIDAILTSGGWPEGYSYWINNRAFPFAVACMAHMNTVDVPD
ncbi:MAG: hypothetical protein JRJ85_21400 [Deltaproteobacteria bacterium]|nr:hypothetical protein [Deltaproteobacteria bacterium]